MKTQSTHAPAIPFESARKSKRSLLAAMRARPRETNLSGKHPSTFASLLVTLFGLSCSLSSARHCSDNATRHTGVAHGECLSGRGRGRPRVDPQAGVCAAGLSVAQRQRHPARHDFGICRLFPRRLLRLRHGDGHQSRSSHPWRARSARRAQTSPLFHSQGTCSGTQAPHGAATSPNLF